jgi:hypothetical protein
MQHENWRRPAPGRALLLAALALMSLVVAARDAGAQGVAATDLAAVAPEGEGGGGKPVREFTDDRGRLCRVYQRDVVIGGEKQPAVAVVCREANGRWVLSR